MNIITVHVNDDILKLLECLISYRIEEFLSRALTVNDKINSSNSFSIPLGKGHFVIVENGFRESPQGVSYSQLSFKYQTYPKDIFYNPDLGLFSPSCIRLEKFSIQRISLWEKEKKFDPKDKAKWELIKYDHAVTFEDLDNNRMIAIKGEEAPTSFIEFTQDPATIKKWLKDSKKRWESKPRDSK